MVCYNTVQIKPKQTKADADTPGHCDCGWHPLSTPQPTQHTETSGRARLL